MKLQIVTDSDKLKFVLLKFVTPTEFINCYSLPDYSSGIARDADVETKIADV